MYNPSLRQEPRNKPAAVIPLQHDASILDWLEKSGRLLDREGKELDLLSEDEEEISALMSGDDSDYEDDDDDDLDLDD